MTRLHRHSLFVLAVVVVLGANCASTKHVNIVLRPTYDMNGSRSCYVLIRAVDPKAFTTDTYAKAAALVTAPDPSVKATAVVVPGKSKSVKVPWPEKGLLVVQALLEAPGRDAWWLLVPDPPPDTFEARLERRSICALDQQRPQQCQQVGR